MNRNHYPKITVVRGADHKEIEVYVIPDEYFSNGTRYEHETPDGGIDYYNDFELIQNKDLLSHNQVELIFPYEPPVKADLALALKRAGFNYECPTAYIFKESGKPIGLIKHSGPMANTPKLEHDAIAPNLHVAAKWLRENLGFDIVVSPRFNSNTGIRVGYFWRISQRTDLRDDKVYKSYENALEAAIRTLLAPFYE